MAMNIKRHNCQLRYLRVTVEAYTDCTGKETITFQMKTKYREND